MLMQRSIRGARLGVAVLAMSFVGGCLWERDTRQKLDLGVDPALGPLAHSAAFRDTIGAATFYEGLRSMRVRGYGLVVGLGRNGSRDCPRNVYDRLVQRLYKRHHFASTVVGVDVVTPEELIDGLDTAVVVVEGDIPPASVKGTRFDVAVMAVPGTQTKSLRGGRLYETDLDVFRPISPHVSITGQVLARAAGPVFVNPFSEGEAATRSNPLEGRIVDGGVVLKSRRIRLVLREPSYPKAKRIQDRINAFFPGPHKVADAISPSYVRLRVPPEYHDDTTHFLGLVRALYLSRDPGFQARRAHALAQEIVQPNAPRALIALALEGLGRAALSVLDRLYTHPQDYVSFYAAVAGFRLDDGLAVDALVMHAKDRHCAFRFQSIRALARAQGAAGAAMALRRLLHDEDPRVQIAAYEALLQRHDPVIQSTPVGGDNFRLDSVRTERPNFVYVKRWSGRRIALFGRDLRCLPPVLYRAPDGCVTVNARPGDETLTILRVVVPTGAVSPPVSAPLELGALIKLLGHEASVGLGGEVVGLGLDYAAVARFLYHMCRDRSINAEFILEEPNAAELFGPARPTGRPESEL